ncbi:hypothetical protein BN2475_1310002 [Paraburkholderia ribeironis]|uniref:Uncharacterized protein n=1 Tax=Paraburkholderia ribeironis TaxID=1247936 RepID=A0A1N7SPK4_9BURK|nr:hypothetical protein BN2475_1310002 [Paraburkholderia ribeironis]
MGLRRQTGEACLAYKRVTPLKGYPFASRRDAPRKHNLSEWIGEDRATQIYLARSGSLLGVGAPNPTPKVARIGEQARSFTTDIIRDSHGGEGDGTAESRSRPATASYLFPAPQLTIHRHLTKRLFHRRV